MVWLFVCKCFCQRFITLSESKLLSLIFAAAQCELCIRLSISLSLLSNVNKPSRYTSVLVLVQGTKIQIVLTYYDLLKLNGETGRKTGGIIRFVSSIYLVWSFSEFLLFCFTGRFIHSRPLPLPMPRLYVYVHEIFALCWTFCA